MTITLAALKRDINTKLSAMRKEGKMPAVFYGPKEPSTPITLSEIDFVKVWKKAGESSVVVLKTPEGDHEALIQQVDVDPVKGNVLHADFYVMEKGKKVQVGIPLTFEGNAPAVKLGGTLTKVLHELEIEAKPSDLPHDLVVNIDSLVDFDAQILAKDIKLPVGVTLITGEDEVIALVSEAKEEVEEVAPVDIANIEISEKKGKKEEEAEPAA